MKTDVTIHLASEADLEALVRLAVAFRDHVGERTPSAEEFCASLALLLHDASAEFFLARPPAGAAVGYGQCRYRYLAWMWALEAELEDVFVVREARRRGVGQPLVAFAMAQAMAKGCRLLGLSTNERNTEAVRLYQRYGFVAESARWQGGRYLWLQRTLEPLCVRVSMATSRGRRALSSARFTARPAEPRDVSVLEPCLEASMRETVLKLLIAPYLKTADSSAVTAADEPHPAFSPAAPGGNRASLP